MCFDYVYLILIFVFRCDSISSPHSWESAMLNQNPKPMGLVNLIIENNVGKNVHNRCLNVWFVWIVWMFDLFDCLNVLNQQKTLRNMLQTFVKHVIEHIDKHIEELKFVYNKWWYWLLMTEILMTSKVGKCEDWPCLICRHLVLLITFTIHWFLEIDK